MYAIVETGGRQFRVAPGDVLRVGKLEGDAGAEIELGRVLAVSSGENEMVAGGEAAATKVKATIVRQGQAPKVLVFKFKRKKQYKRTIGHRQDFTEVRVGEIG